METVHGRILLAEDDEAMRSMLAFMLTAEGFEVTPCVDGLELADRIKEDGDEVDLVISDIRMPGMTGLELLEGLSVLDESPPMILITAFGGEDTLEKALHLGAAAVFSKPFDVEDLIEKAHEVMNGQ
jgi:CheY-like chemotaxis protein